MARRLELVIIHGNAIRRNALNDIITCISGLWVDMFVALQIATTVKIHIVSQMVHVPKADAIVSNTSTERSGTRSAKRVIIICGPDEQ